MVLQYNPQNEPVMRAAKMALETGNANYILIWVPEESENTLKNLLERTYCNRSAQKEKMQDRAIDWYFEIVNRLHYAGRWPHYPYMKFERLDEKLVALKVESAIETGKFEEIISVIPDMYTEDVRQHYHDVMNKRNYNVNNITAGRAYVAAFTDFISYLLSLPSINLGERHHTEH